MLLDYPLMDAMVSEILRFSLARRDVVFDNPRMEARKKILIRILVGMF